MVVVVVVVVSPACRCCCSCMVMRTACSFSFLLQSLTANIEKIEESLPQQRSQLKTLEQQMTSLQEELGTPLDTSLTASEQQKLLQVEKDNPQLNKQLNKATEAMNKKKHERYGGIRKKEAKK